MYVTQQETGKPRPSIWGLAPGLALLQACGAVSIPPPRVVEDPEVHERYFVASHAQPRVLVLERREPERAQLWALDLVTSTHTPLGPPLHLAPWPNRAQLVARLSSSAAASLVAQAGFVWTEVRSLAPAPFGLTLALRDDAFVVRVPDVEPFELAAWPRTPAAIDWIADPSGRGVGVEVTYAGHPAVRALHHVTLTGVAADLWAQSGYAAHLRGDYRTSRARWQQAWDADPEPFRRDLQYNLACAAARLGEPARALQHLARALHADPGPLYTAAFDDPDFESLRGLPAFHALLGAAAIGPPAPRPATP